MSNKQKLFTEFPAVSTQEWMDKAIADLKGADFEKKLVWRTNEGFNVKPFHREEDLAGLKTTGSVPGHFPYVRGTKADNSWLIRQDIDVCNDCLAAANAKAVDLLTKGVTSLGFVIDREAVSAENIAALLNGIDIEKVEVNFKTCATVSVKLTEIFVAYAQKAGADPKKVFGSVNFDLIGRSLARGKAIENLVQQYVDIINASLALPKFRVIGVNPFYLNNAGSYIYQELGYALAWGNDIIAKLVEAGLTVEVISKKIKFNFGVSSNYFMEIAKFRAARFLWSNIVFAYGEKCPRTCSNNQPDGLERCGGKMRIHAQTSEWNMTIFDAHVNLLRTQTESMSAILAGVDSLTVLPFDAAYKESDDFSERIARNQQLLLKEESHFDKIVDPAAGSYYLENLTESIANQAWKLFLEVEEKGGFIAEVEAGNIQTVINTTNEARRKAVSSRREVLLGSNQYPNFNEVAAAKIETEAACDCAKHDEVPALNFSRGASDFEALRLATEKSGKRPKVFMLTIGNLAMRLARAQFSSNFFACAGYEIIDNLGFETVEEGVAAAEKAGADIIVICSSDDEYAELAPAAFKAIAGKKLFVVAGAPACTDDLKAVGIEYFVNVKSNVLETLKGFNAKLL
ncbi:methylmalonyl-CoA mutase small subunit [Paludibacter jiangxiensis]|uniref:Methylmalonyl-CoA mutase small subunit n=1 Tax=Paludibacter jiangxiensis TaxID=681398 RepID=A0A161L7F7_9BACT|nr:methylmalonyl-CoA mutase small subunit [Paludibacter jiangxiensis]GAT62654.1 methylmalonyl-CoA mutase [Paludibacter jiangxiensis]